MALLQAGKGNSVARRKEATKIYIDQGITAQLARANFLDSLQQLFPDKNSNTKTDYITYTILRYINTDTQAISP